VVQRRERALARDRRLELQRIRSEAFDPDALMRRTLQEHFDRKADSEAREMRDRYVRGDHVLGKTLREQFENFRLEEDLYNTAASLIARSEPMQDFDAMHIGEVGLPPASSAEVEYMRAQTEKVTQLRLRNEAFMKVKNTASFIRQTLFKITQNEDEIAMTLADVQAHREERGFDWALERNRYVNDLKASIERCREAVAEGRERLQALTAEALARYPDMTFDVEFQFS
jgi:cation diffusion facilitator CzcD-associated flavoprotein CzcO